MAKYYGEIPCTRKEKTVHITKNAVELLCGGKWMYSLPRARDDRLPSANIIWRELEAVTCPDCKRAFEEGKRWE